MRTLVLVCTAGVLAIALPTSAAVIGPFGTLNGADAYWDTALVVDGYTTGTASVAGGQLQENPNAGSKVWFLPWDTAGDTAGEKMTMAQLNLNGSVDNVHAKIYDPATSGTHGWQVILMDDAGKALWFGIKTNPFGVGKINAYQWNGTSFSYPTNWGRTRTGNDYYSMDFAQNTDGTIAITLAGSGGASGVSGNYTTTVAFGDITEVYLSTSAGTSTGVLYKWTEFTATPEPATVGLLGLGMLLGLRRRRA